MRFTTRWNRTRCSPGSAARSSPAGSCSCVSRARLTRWPATWSIQCRRSCTRSAPLYCMTVSLAHGGDVGPDSRGEDEQAGGRRYRLGLGEDRLDARLREAQRACLRGEEEAELIQAQFAGARNGGLEHLERTSGVALQGEGNGQRLLGSGKLDQGANAAAAAA